MNKKAAQPLQVAPLFISYRLFLRMCLIGFSKCFQFYNACLIPYSPGHDLFGMFTVIGLDDSPSTVRTVMTAPFKMMKVTCRVDLFDNCITVAGLMW